MKYTVGKVGITLVLKKVMQHTSMNSATNYYYYLERYISEH